MSRTYEDCGKCNGTGKVKINARDYCMTAMCPLCYKRICPMLGTEYDWGEPEFYCVLGYTKEINNDEIIEVDCWECEGFGYFCY